MHNLKGGSRLHRTLMIVGSMVAKKLGIKFRISGTMAYHSAAEKLINIPYGDMECPVYATKALGFTIHEGGHGRFTVQEEKPVPPTPQELAKDPSLKGKFMLTQWVWNALEDTWMEGEVFKLYPGFRKYLYKLVEMLAGDLDWFSPTKDEDTALSAMQSYILYNLRYQVLDQPLQELAEEATEVFRKKISDDLFDAITNKMFEVRQSTTTGDNTRIAQELVQLIIDEQEQNQQQSQQGQGESDSDDQSDEDDSESQGNNSGQGGSDDQTDNQDEGGETEADDTDENQDQGDGSDKGEDDQDSGSGDSESGSDGEDEDDSKGSGSDDDSDSDAGDDDSQDSGSGDDSESGEDESQGSGSDDDSESDAGEEDDNNQGSGSGDGSDSDADDEGEDEGESQSSGAGDEPDSDPEADDASDSSNGSGQDDGDDADADANSTSEDDKGASQDAGNSGQQDSNDASHDTQPQSSNGAGGGPGSDEIHAQSLEEILSGEDTGRSADISDVLDKLVEEAAQEYMDAHPGERGWGDYSIPSNPAVGPVIDASPADLRNRVAGSTKALSGKLRELLDAQALDDETLTSQSPRVDLDALRRLREGDVNIFIEEAEEVLINTAMVVLMDRSTSMSEDIRLATDATAAAALAVERVENARVAVAAYPGRGAEAVMPLTQMHEKPSRTLGRYPIAVDGSTPTAEALWWAGLELAKAMEERKIILLISDGSPDSVEATQKAIKVLKDSDVEIIGVGIGAQADASLKALLGNENAVGISDVSELARALFSVLREKLVLREAA